MILPILEVLVAKYPNQWSVHSEHSAVVNELPYRHAIEDGELTGKPRTVRYDLVFKRKPSKKTFAIIEYKKRETIRFKDFEKAWLDQDVTRPEVERIMAKNPSSLLKINALCYLQQMACYARVERCRHVALFNYDSLIIVDFEQVHQSGAMSAGDEAYATWVSETYNKSLFDSTGKPPKYIEPNLYRRCLLGFMIKAIQEE
ncbi:hypothetical protein GQ44DRAFT_685322 [Phaeosphaeriaceae sp. PMI808]|nr:hypothetical protein GQ44DRAFT_685322 [Phaeosphaeriaceae sp. PMI808]